MDPEERSRRLAAGLPVAETVAGPAWSTDGPFRDQIRAGEFASPQVRTWRDQIHRISDDLVDLQASRSVIDRLRSVVQANPRLQSYNLLLERIFRWYATSTLVLAHRDVQDQRDVVSLVRLLEAIARNAGELTRDRYRKLHTGSTIAAVAAGYESLGAYAAGKVLELSYDKLAGPNRNTLNVDAINADVAALVAAATDVEAARHTVYAHRAAAGASVASISLGTIHDFVDLLDTVVNKYRGLLLYEPYFQGHTPVDQTNWTEILTFPWILPRESDSSVPYAATPAVARTLLRALPDDERRELLREFLD
jgi:hypothetical protein